MSFQDIKARSRRAVHAKMAVPCVLVDGGNHFSVTARFHDAITIGGDIASQGYANTIEGITHVVFNREELATARSGSRMAIIIGVVPKRGDYVTFSNYAGTGGDLTVQLDARIPYDGPVTEKWSVAVI